MCPPHGSDWLPCHLHLVFQASPTQITLTIMSACLFGPTRVGQHLFQDGRQLVRNHHSKDSSYPEKELHQCWSEADDQRIRIHSSPTTSKFDPIGTATQLAKFATDNLFDGVDVDWEDTASFQLGDRQARTGWSLLPKLWESYCLLDPSLPMLLEPHTSLLTSKAMPVYPAGAYLTVDKEAGSLIEFYNIQFYNQGKGVYDYAAGQFNISGGWAP